MISVRITQSYYFPFLSLSCPGRSIFIKVQRNITTNNMRRIDEREWVEGENAKSFSDWIDDWNPSNVKNNFPLLWFH